MGFSKSHGACTIFKIPRRECTNLKSPRRMHDFQKPTAWAYGFQKPTAHARFSKAHGVSADFKSPRRVRVRAAKRPSERFDTQDDKKYRAAQENA